MSGKSMTVRLSDEGRANWEHEDVNPHNQTGIVLKVDSRTGFLPIHVRWENGEVNSYDHGDLEAA